MAIRYVQKRIDVDPALWRMVRAAAMLEGISISEWIEVRLRAELAGVLEPPAEEELTVPADYGSQEIREGVR